MRGGERGDEGGSAGGAGGGERELIGGGAAEADGIGGPTQDGDERGHGLSIDGEGAQRGGAEGTRGLGVEEEGEKRTIFLREREIAHGIGGAAGEDRIGEAEGADEGPVHP